MAYLDRFQPPDDLDEFIVATDWSGQDIWNYYDDLYYHIDGHYIHDDDIQDFMRERYEPKTIKEWRNLNEYIV